MAKFNAPDQKAIPATDIFSIISLDAGIFGWIVGLSIMLMSFTPLSNYFQFSRLAGLFLLALPGVSWLTGILAGMIGVRQIKINGSQSGAGLAKSGIVMSGIGCALLYGFFLLVALGFYMLISNGYIGFMLPSGTLLV